MPYLALRFMCKFQSRSSCNKIILLGASQRDGVLTLRNVEESFRGRYQCTITIAAGISGTGFVDLQVSSSQVNNSKLSY